VGDIVPVHSVLVVYDLGGAGGGAEAHAPAPTEKKKDDGPAATAVGDIKEDLPGMSLFASKPAAAAGTNGHAAHAAPQPSSYFNEKPLATPATRQLARTLGVDLRTVPPSGPSGRVTKTDVQQLASGGGLATHAPAPAHARAPQAEAPAAPARSYAPQAITSTAVSGAEPDERTALRGVRKRIFEGMTRSKHTAAHFTFVEEVDCEGLVALRERLKPAADKAGVKLTYLPFITKAVVAALKKHPSLASAFDEATNEIVTRKSRNIGIATSTEAGLIVPVVRDADRKSILDIARDIARLGEDAKAGKVRPEDLGGSVFTITSLGAQGGLFATPILNFPEVGILGVHQMKEKPVVKNGQIVVGKVMLLSLSFDHRIIDGHVGAAFAYEIIGYLQDPDRLFLEMA
ncbi:MAG: 2-oxo acid dehydrogenase subunit E2, partial [Polyangiaceae bacterium]|nr:2-oxo acid dehydrogenase subunit E2 [Polyangiaceae bacterium]